jgi:Flp pilus assembly protein TadG
MKPTTKSLLFRAIRDERGQIVPMMMAGLLMAMFGLTAISVDLGNVYLTFQRLQASTNAAALAGAQALPNLTATTQATQYSSSTGNLNAFTNLPNVTTVSTIKCLTTLTNEGLPCYAPGNGNAVQVTQSTSVKLYFASLLGAPPVPLTTMATAAARGAIAGPFNVVLLLDTTASMGQPANTSECSGTNLQCAIQGIQTLLLELAPCEASVTTCTVSSGVAKNPVDQVSLFTFPNATTTTITDDTNCSGGRPSIEPYTFPSATGTTYTSNPELIGSTSYNMTYQVTSFLSNYRTGDTTTSLNASSALSAAAGAGGSGCGSIQAPGGESTYYAGAIYAAQAALVAQKASETGNPAQNVIIMLSDGDATAASANLANKTQAAGGLYAEQNGSGVYPSVNAQCTQAVTAAQYAATQGTRVYSVAYNPETSGCTTGDKYTPCTTMQAIASSAQYFYADTNATGSAACTSVNNTTSLQGIFTSIGQSFLYARLIPNGTT